MFHYKPDSLLSSIYYSYHPYITGFNKSVRIGMQVCVLCLSIKHTQLYAVISRSSFSELFWKIGLQVLRT